MTVVRHITLGVDGISATIEGYAERPVRYIINNNATILFWEDGSKTVVKRCEDDTYDKRLGFLIAYFQHHSGLSKTKANKFLANLKEED